MTTKAQSNGATVGFEEKLWAAADKMRGHMDPAEYKHVALGLIFLKYISDAFEERTAPGCSRHSRADADPEDRDEYIAENVFWVPREARWGYLQANAKQADDRQAHRRRHGGHRAGEPEPQGRAAQGLRPPATSTSSSSAS